MKRILVALCVVASTGWALAQAGDMGGYNAMRIDAGQFKGSFGANFAIDEMTEGVSITLLSDDPDLKDLPIHAYTMTFEWAEGAGQPTLIKMRGNVKVSHPDASVSAEAAEWDFNTGTLVFTGNPEMNNEHAQGMKAERFIIDLKNNTLEASGFSADRVDVGEGAAGGDPNKLRETDVTDWPGFIDTLKTQARAGEASPGRQIMDRLGPTAEGMLLNMPTQQLVENKKELLGKLNDVLAEPGLYDKQAWASTTLSEEATTLLEKSERTPEEQRKLNRLLLEAAYPTYIKE